MKQKNLDVKVRNKNVDFVRIDFCHKIVGKDFKKQCRVIRDSIMKEWKCELIKNEE